VRFIIDNRIVLSRAPQGPLAKYIVPFAKAMREQGYARYSLYRQVLLAACFSEWLRKRDVALGGITSDHPRRYLRYGARKVSLCRGDAAALRHLLDFLCHERVIPTEKKLAVRTLTSGERCAQAYEQYLREARGLARTTLINYVPFIRSFLKDRFGSGPVTLSHLCARDVVGFVQRQASRLHPKRAKLLTSALRSFLQYARYRGKVRLDLAAAVPIVPNWSMSSIPRAIGSDTVRQLLASIDRSTAVGRRDYAILLLLARLGLRSGEVASLELDEIDWKAGQLNVRGKSGQRNDLPLPVEVGQAIAAYLRQGRPRGSSRRVFLRARAPVRGFRGTSGVGSVVRHRLLRAGVDAPTYGSHQFRHGLATEMLRQGASLGEIGELLGHHSPETTKIYTKVDLDALRTLALPWPGGVR
jgi:site-specific recombinase XerD